MRTVPCISQLSGTTLVASPVWIIVTEITPASIGRLLRLMMVWKALTIWHATGTGSMPLCGIAACDPLPRIVTLNSLLDANAGPRLERELARLQARPVVRAEHGFHRELLEQAVLHHLARAAAAFFGRLEDQVDRAVVVAVLREMLGGGEQHRRVAVVAARVHLAGARAAVREGVLLGDRQRVHVGAQADGARAAAVLQDRDDAGRSHAAVDRDAPRRELRGDQVGGALLLEAELGMGVDVAPERGDLGGVGEDGFDDLHGRLLRGQFTRGLRPEQGLCHSLEMVTTVVRAACPHDCPDTCAMLVTVEDGRAIRVHGNPDHPPTHGALCTKVSRYVERTYHPDRVLRPLKRVGPKGSGSFAPVSWDEALDDIAARLKAIAGADGANAEAIVPYSYCGTMGMVQGESMAGRFFHKLGASLLDRTICSSAGGEALAATYGAKVGMHVEHYAESRLIVIWGSNSITSNLHFWTLALQARRAGAKLVCIDPRRTDTAEKCHEHIALLPGSDGALALGVMHELIANDWLDHDYIDRHVDGWPALRERALQWPPERVAAVCGIPVEQVRSLARDYGSPARRRSASTTACSACAAAAMRRA